MLCPRLGHCPLPSLKQKPASSLRHLLPFEPSYNRQTRVGSDAIDKCSPERFLSVSSQRRVVWAEALPVRCPLHHPSRPGLPAFVVLFFWKSAGVRALVV